MSILPSAVIDAAQTQDFVPEYPKAPVKPPREAQYLISLVGPPLKSGLAEIVSKMPKDPIEYLAQYLYKHAESVAHVAEVARQAEEMKEALEAQEEERKRALEHEAERRRIEEEEKEKERQRIAEEEAEAARQLAAEEEARLTVTLAPVAEGAEPLAEGEEGAATTESSESALTSEDGEDAKPVEEGEGDHEEKLATLTEQEEPSETPAPTVGDDTEEKFDAPEKDDAQLEPDNDDDPPIPDADEE